LPQCSHLVVLIIVPSPVVAVLDYGRESIR
jgi:hypothetical protein